MDRLRGGALRVPTLQVRGEYLTSVMYALGFYVGQAGGMWRSLVARTAGGREVAGSSPVIPTTR